MIMDVVNAEQARIAEEAGACAVMALERVPADIRKDGMFTKVDSEGNGRQILTIASVAEPDLISSTIRCCVAHQTNRPRILILEKSI